MKNVTLLAVIASLLLAFCQAISPAEEKKAESMPFAVYLDKDTKNHYIASGWLGDWGDLAVSDSTDNPREGTTCLKWVYSAKKSQGQNWAGCYWQEPAGNWGDKEGGYNLSQAKRLTFWARGEKGGEVVTFMMGGVISERGFGDTCSVKLENERLPKEWKKYTLALQGKNPRNIITGFGFVVTESRNPKGCTFYLDNIIYDN